MMTFLPATAPGEVIAAEPVILGTVGGFANVASKYVVRLTFGLVYCSQAEERSPLFLGRLWFGVRVRGLRFRALLHFFSVVSDLHV